MKKTLFSLFTCFCILSSPNAIAQNIEIYAEGTTNDISGTEVYATGDLVEMSYYFDLKNVSGNQLELTVKRLKLQDVANTLDYFCWGQNFGNCYIDSVVSAQNPWTAPDDLIFANNDEGILQVHYKPNNVNGTAKFRYYILDQNDVAIDSIDVTFNAFLSVKPQKSVDISIYPNPANEVLNIVLQNSTSNYSASIFDLSGKMVSNISLVNGKNQLDVSALTPGVYFYSIKNNSDILETKKLVIH